MQQVVDLAQKGWRTSSVIRPATQTTCQMARGRNPITNISEPTAPEETTDKAISANIMICFSSMAIL